MTTPREDFIEGIYVLSQYRDGYYSYRSEKDDWTMQYANGFFTAVTQWISGAYDKSYYIPDDDWDAAAGFRVVVNAHQNGMCDGYSEEWTRGYEDALLIFREAKGLSSGSA